MHFWNFYSAVYSIVLRIFFRQQRQQAEQVKTETHTRYSDIFYLQVLCSDLLFLSLSNTEKNQNKQESTSKPDKEGGEAGIQGG